MPCLVFPSVLPVLASMILFPSCHTSDRILFLPFSSPKRAPELNFGNVIVNFVASGRVKRRSSSARTV